MSSLTVPQSSCLLIFSWSIIHKLNIHQLHWKVTEVSHNYSILVSTSSFSFRSSAAITTAKTETSSLQRNHQVLLGSLQSPTQFSLIKGSTDGGCLPPSHLN